MTLQATCQVAHVTNGRIRLRVAEMRSRPEIGPLLVALLLRLPGVTAVQVRSAGATVIVSYDPAECTQESILHALRLRQVREENDAGAFASTSEASFPYAGSSVLHAIRGRVRLSVPALKADGDLGVALARHLEAQDGMTKVRINRTAASVTVEHEASAWDSRSILMLVRAYRPDLTELDLWQPPDGPAQQSTQAGSTRQKWELALAGSALGLSLAIGPAAAPLAYGLLWFSSWSIFRRAQQTLFGEHRLTVDTLDAAAITLLSIRGMFWQAALLNMLLSGADWIRSSTQERARKALCEVLDYMQDNAWVICDGQITSIPAREVTVGETVLVFPGERIPVDGVVLAGRALVDQHALTGESMPVEKTVDDTVFAATVVNEGELRVRTTSTGDQTQVARIIQMVEHTPVFDTRSQNYAERWANRLVPYSFLGAGVLALLGRPDQAITLLVIDYAAGFKVAAPTTIMTTMTRAARRGIFIRGGRHVEQVAVVDALVFDKTGTLTRGCPDVVDLVAVDGRYGADDILALAAAAEQQLTHPVAEAIVKAAMAKQLTIAERTSFDYEIGQGVAAQLEELTVLVGSRRFLTRHGVPIRDEAEALLSRIETQTASPLCVAVDGLLVGLLGLADPIRPESAEVVKALRARGIERIVMLTGDRAPVAAAVAGELGIEHFVAEAFPADKLSAVQALQDEGYTVAVIGDGINDSPALAQADVGIAVNGSTALAQETADVVILQGDLGKLIDAIDIAREGMALVRQNWEIVRVPNTIGLGLAFTGAIGPLGASLISDGAALVAGGNSLRPLANKGADSGRLQTKNEDELPKFD